MLAYRECRYSLAHITEPYINDWVKYANDKKKSYPKGSPTTRKATSSPSEPSNMESYKQRKPR